MTQPSTQITPALQLDLMSKLDALRDAVEATRQTFAIQLGWQVTPVGMPGAPDLGASDYGSTIAVTSPSTLFNFAVVCSEAATRSIATLALDLDPDTEPALCDLADSLVEVPNVAAGLWKTFRKKRDESYQLGLPIFMRGSGWIRFFSKGVNAIAQKLRDPDGQEMQVILIWQSGDPTGGNFPMTTQTSEPLDVAESLPITVLQEAVEATITTCDVQVGLKLDVQSDPSDPREAKVDFGSSIALTTEVGGGWNLAVMADRSSCNQLTRVLFAMDADEEPELDDLADGLGELVNVAAGVLKAKRLEAGERVQLGLPLFMEGRGCIEFFACGLRGLSQSLNGPDGLVIHVILIWQEG